MNPDVAPMDPNYSADENTRQEVDLMVLDYLVCEALNKLLNARIAERRRQNYNQDVEAPLCLASTFQSVVSAEALRSCDLSGINTKLKILAFAEAFFTLTRRRAWSIGRRAEQALVDATDNDMLAPGLSSLKDQFLSLCGLAAILRNCQRLDLLAQYFMQVTLERTHMSEKALAESFRDCLTQAPTEITADPLWAKTCEGYAEFLERPAHQCTSAHLRLVLREFHFFKFEDMVIQCLLDILDKLDLPVLYQLESGALDKG